ncbi:MAG: hypothetical protein ACRBC3_13850 [Burkholderiaceae bacterium]
MIWTEYARPKRAAMIGLGLALAAQFWLNSNQSSGWRAQTEAADVPGRMALRLASLGEDRAAATAAALYAQSFDAQAGRSVPINRLNLERLQQWLILSSELQPDSAYPTFLASRFFAEKAAPMTSRSMLTWILERHEISPAAHWPALAHAVQIARHQLDDAALARTLAAGLRQTDPSIRIPAWARQMEGFLQSDADELEEARALVGGLIAHGDIKDQKALAVLMQDLRDIERRLAADKRPQ